MLHPDRYFDPEPATRRIARELYEGTSELPIVSPHGHVDPRILAENSPFEEPAALIVTPDHYILRMIFSRGISLANLGVQPKDGAWYEQNPRRIWQLFADHYHHFRATPTGGWVDYVLHHVFGVTTRLNSTTGQIVYDEIAEKLRSPEFRPRALFERFRIEVLATTDAATDPLSHHQAIRSSGWKGRVLPTFRPDRLFQIDAREWIEELGRLGELTRSSIGSYEAFLSALRDRREFFRSLGGTATDHGVEEPFTTILAEDEVAGLFTRALGGTATRADQRKFQGHMLVEMARMSAEDGMVMQLHAGSLRDHNGPLLRQFGPNIGSDIPVATEWTRNLRPLLNELGGDDVFRIILFTLDEATYSRELAPLAGHYPAVILGPAWWFHDSAEGIRRFRERTTETAGIYNTAGFNDDTRGFCSIPARHDLSRRIEANWLAGMVARHVIELSDAHEMAYELAYNLPRKAYRLDEPKPEIRAVEA